VKYSVSYAVEESEKVILDTHTWNRLNTN